MHVTEGSGMGSQYCPRAAQASARGGEGAGKVRASKVGAGAKAIPVHPRFGSSVLVARWLCARPPPR
jgi:hypothetical protein